MSSLDGSHFSNVMTPFEAFGVSHFAHCYVVLSIPVLSALPALLSILYTIMTLQQSELIWRKQLSAVSGGGTKKNPLNLATPISFTGGRALATKNKVVAHITIKEKNNLPLPLSPKEDFIVWRIGDKPKSDILYITEKNQQNEQYKHSKGIPLFWEPDEQEHGKTKVLYVGHWKITNHSIEKKEVEGLERCGSMTFSFDRFDAKFANVISKASQMTEKEIAEYDFDSLVNMCTTDTESSSTEDETNDNDSASTTNIADDTSNATNFKATKSEPKQQKVARASENAKPDEIHSSKKRSRERVAAAKEHAAARATKRGRTSQAGETKNVAVAPNRIKRRDKEKRRSAAAITQPKHQDSSPSDEQGSDDEAFEDEKKPAARNATTSSTAAAAAQRKPLKDYSPDQVAKLFEHKGKEFRRFAERVKKYHFEGETFAEQLEKGDDNFLSFLERICGLNGDGMLRYSIMVSFKKVM